MNNFSFYESRKLNDGYQHWVFYNEIKKNREWKFWAPLEKCGKKPDKCYDPCDWCFNPCDKTPDVVTEINGVEVSRTKDWGTACCYCVLFFFFCAILFISCILCFLFGLIFTMPFAKREEE